jgi:hypothetical protein
MKKLIRFTILLSLSMIFLISSRLITRNGFDWLALFPMIMLVAIIVRFFIEYKKLNKLK